MRSIGRGRLVFVTGARGFLGRHLVGSPLTAKWDLIALPSNQLDLRDAESVLDEIKAWRPAAVVHLAYRRDDPRAIVTASANVAAGAAAVGARLVHLSTDVVFGGRPRPYVESDLHSPITDYGRWKAAAEIEVAAACPTAVIVRTSLIYGTEHLGPVQTDVQEALAGRTAMRFFTDEVRCPVFAGDLAAAIVQLVGRRDISGPLHVAGPEAIDRASLARLIARWFGRDPGLVQTSTIAESGLNRPARVVLDVGQAASLGITCRPVSDVLRA
ncbi:MAG: sugar nucleotide-binding protein [Actinobacteria bacterium]|nr:sugar nucleotide-binding protein [Actinomycetota bacterium]